MNFPDYPFTSRYIVIQGHKLHYIDEGPRDAEPIVMLHGNPSWSFYYRKLVLGLREKYRCIVPDHIGMGYSDKPATDDYNFLYPRRADDLSSLLENLGIKKNLTLVLHDWGGMIGMTYASYHPESIQRLIVLNTAAFHLPAGKRLPLSLSISRIPVINAILLQGLNAFCRGAVKYGVTRKPLPADVAAAYLAPYDSWRHRLAVRRFVEDIPLRPVDPGYKRLSYVAGSLAKFRSLPMLICWGMRDFVFDESFLDEWILRFPDAELHRFADSGHYVLEDAADEIIPLVKDFLDRNPVNNQTAEDTEITRKSKRHKI